MKRCVWSGIVSSSIIPQGFASAIVLICSFKNSLISTNQHGFSILWAPYNVVVHRV